MTVRRFHGVQPRGLATNPKSPAFEGTFGRMFRTLPAAPHTDSDLMKLAEAMVADDEGKQTPETERDDEENLGIDAGYTYLGQFIDHDLTFDPASSLQKTNDPDGITDFRTPRFDLDNVYGRGPDDQPYLYEPNGIKMLLGRPLTDGNGVVKTRDLPRLSPAYTSQPGMSARALIGDPRNDENVIVSQLHGSILRFHNRVYEFMSAAGQEPTFAEVQKQVRWHYQWVVLHDFLSTIVGEKVIHDILPHLSKPKGNIYINKPNLNFFHWKNEPYIPVEFSVAAYRFGHSMVRPIYRLSTTLNPALPNGEKGRFMIFVDPQNEIISLLGFRAFPANWAIDWDLFFNPGNAPLLGTNRIQKAYKIDTSLVNPLGKLPTAVTSGMPSLAGRNLLRGKSMGLPSGQTVARFMGLPVIPDNKLIIGKATQGAKDKKEQKPITSISPLFADNAPLWYYILAEAQQAFVDDDTPILLGPVGGRIVAEVFIGIMLGDQYSFLSQEPNWKPFTEFLEGGEFKMIDLIKQAQKSQLVQPV